MANSYDFSAAAQYSALGAMLRNPPAPAPERKPQEISMSGLAALGRCTGFANHHPAPKPANDLGLTLPAAENIAPINITSTCDA